MADIKSLDLNLLKALDALLETRSVTRAADKLGLTQPAVSGMLTRLRDALNDPLFIRTQRGILPTPRAESLATPLRMALGEIQKLLVAETFDPARATMTITIAATDYAQKAILLPLMSTLRTEAPGIRIAVRPVDLPQLSHQMESGLVDLALITPEMAQDTMRSRRLFDENYVCVLRHGHPASKEKLDINRLCTLEHGIMSHDGSRFWGATDEALARQGRSRRVVVSVPSFMVLIDLVRHSDIMALLPERLVEGCTDLYVCEPPLEVSGFTKILAWHERLQQDPAHSWIRERLAALVAPRAGQRPPSTDLQSH